MHGFFFLKEHKKTKLQEDKKGNEFSRKCSKIFLQKKAADYAFITSS